MQVISASHVSSMDSDSCQQVVVQTVDVNQDLSVEPSKKVFFLSHSRSFQRNLSRLQVELLRTKQLNL